VAELLEVPYVTPSYWDLRTSRMRLSRPLMAFPVDQHSRAAKHAAKAEHSKVNPRCPPPRVSTSVCGSINGSWITGDAHG
jgi:hypothetical protein